MCKRASLPAPIRSSHHWTFRLVDRRRESLRSREDSNTISGVETRSHSLPHLGSDFYHTGFAQLVPLGEAECEDEGDPDDAGHVTGIPGEVREYLGWATSYRKQDPEDVAKHKDK